MTDNTPPDETELGIITTPTVFPLESLRTRLVIDEFSPSTIAKVSGSHSSFSLQSLAEVGMNVELGDGEITSGGNISTGGRMMRDSLGVIEMDGLDAVLLLSLGEKLVDVEVEDVLNTVLV